MEVLLQVGVNCVYCKFQAEFGDHDPEKHTLEYLQDFPLLPKPMMSQFPEDKLSTLTDAIISQVRGEQRTAVTVVVQACAPIPCSHYIRENSDAEMFRQVFFFHC